MQNLKPKFQEKTKERLSTLQSCIRTNDIDLWGDGTHFVFFRMLGCFSFGNREDYPIVVNMWLDIMKELEVNLTSVHVHPDSNHREIYQRRLLEDSGVNFVIIDDTECVWSDGNIGGFCSEFYVGDVEIGNLVNPMGDSVDVGFGFERLCRVLGEQYEETFDLEQFLVHCWKNKVEPGNKGRNYTVRKILRKWIKITKTLNSSKEFLFSDWISSENIKMEQSFKFGKKLIRKHFDKPDSWWWETSGLLPDEVQELRKQFQLQST
jgi:alanyl-tRNA synthetase